jgi:2-iminobutanoate/2-iminopropanoate deaminase
MTKRAVRSAEAPAPIGPYSQAVIAGSFAFCSGQVALLPDGSLAAGGVRAEAEVVLRNLVAVLAAAGCTSADVVKTTVYLVDMADFAAVNEIYARTFSGATPPARATVAVAGLPKGARVEIDAVALVPST